MSSVTCLMDLNEDVLREVCAAAALVHPPHWQRKGSTSTQLHEHEPNRNTVHKSTSNWGMVGPATYCIGWIYLSHVNRRLRQICLSSPTLWANNVFCIPSPSRDVLETVLARARQVPLTMYVAKGSTGGFTFPPFTPQAEYQAKLDLVVENLDRAAVCRVQSPTLETDIDWVPVFENRSFPRLLTLALSSIALRDAKNPEDDIDQDADSSQRVLSLATPNLVELYLTPKLFPSSANAMVSLRKLHISLNENNIDRAALVADNLVSSFLNCAPSLEELSLNLDFCPLTEFNGELLQSNVKLAHLRKATIFMTGPSQKHTVWSKIEASTVANVCLHFYDEHGTAADPAIGLRSAASELAHTTHCSVKLNAENDKIALQVASLRDDGGVNHGIGLEWRPRLAHLKKNILNTHPQFIVPANITRLHFVHFRVPENETSLLDLLRALHSVTDLIFETILLTAVPGATDGVAELAHPLGVLAIETSVLPALRTLKISYDNGFRARRLRLEHYQMHWEAIETLLQTRAAAGNPVQVFKLFGRRTANPSAVELDKEMVKTIAAYVQEVVDAQTA